MLTAATFGIVVRAGTAETATLLSSPKRIASGRAYDLQPLFTWWTDISKKSGSELDKTLQEHSRPLTNWVRVTGRYITVQYSGWLVDADIYLAPHGQPYRAKVILLNPPANEKKEFESLLAEKANLESGIDQAHHDQVASSSDARYYQGKASYDIVGESHTAYVNGEPAQVAPVLSHWENTGMAKKAARAQNAAQLAAADRAHMANRLAYVNARLGDLAPSGHKIFPVDVFATGTGKYYPASGAWIYDCGVRR